jgi:hypothetical protein
MPAMLVVENTGDLPGGRQKCFTKREAFMKREGTLHILRMNGAAHNEVSSYHVIFADYQSGAGKIRVIMGTEHLKSFLAREIGVRSEAIESTFEGLKRESTANIFNVELPDDKLAKLELL